MRFVRPLVTLFALGAIVTPALAKDGGSFVVRLGQDTVSVEQYVRLPDRLEVFQVGRAPHTLRRHFIYDYAGGNLKHFSMVVTPPGSTTPTQTIDAVTGPDSLHGTIQNGTAAAQPLRSPVLPPGTLLIPTSSPWTGYEGQVMRLVESGKDSLRVPLLLLGANNMYSACFQKLGKDSVIIFNDHGDRYNARIDKAGHLLGVRPISGTQKFSVDRVDQLDLDAMAASYQAREQAGAGMGMLSPRDTVRAANAGGASLWVDYGRPAKRGRVVVGNLIPYGDVWRTGANAATQFKTDKALDFGGTVVPAGFYTLWTIASADGWKLVVNSETGQWGTEHKADKDLYTIPMKVSTLPQMVERFTIGIESNAQGGVLDLDWDTTRASAAFTVKP
jgi:hypothetical protein